MPDQMRKIMDMLNDPYENDKHIKSITVLGIGFENKGAQLGGEEDNTQAIEMTCQITINGLPSEVTSQINDSTTLQEFVDLLKKEKVIN